MNYREIMKNILDLSRRMLEMAQTGDWDEVQRAEYKRQELVKKTGPLPTDEQEAKAAQDIIQSVLSINEQILSLSKQQIGACRDALTEVAKGRRAVKAYGS